LERREYGIDDQDTQAKKLKAKFHIFTPIASFFVGWGISGWGLWRLRRGSNWKHLGWGFGALVTGFCIAYFGLGLYVIIAF
jgi:hypothetical protein